MCLAINTTSTFWGGGGGGGGGGRLHWIKKQSSCECLLEHRESSGAKIMMRGPIVHQLCKQRNKDEFHISALLFSTAGTLP